MLIKNLSLINLFSVSHFLTWLLLAAATTYGWAQPVTEQVNDTDSPYKLKLVPVQVLQPAIPPADKPRVDQLEYKSITGPQKPPPRLIRTALPDNNAVASQSQPKILLPRTGVDTRFYGQPFFSEIELAAKEASLDPALVHAVIYVESRYRHDAISRKGAIGLMQVLPGTAARYGISDVGLSAKANLQAGTLYLRDLMRRFDNRIELVLAAYNAGEGAVLKYSRQIPPYPETRLYVLAVMNKYQEWHAMETLAQGGEDEVAVEEDGEALNLLPEPKPVIPVPEELRKTEYMVGTRLVLSAAESARND